MVYVYANSAVRMYVFMKIQGALSLSRRLRSPCNCATAVAVPFAQPSPAFITFITRGHYIVKCANTKNWNNCWARIWNTLALLLLFAIRRVKCVSFAFVYGFYYAPSAFMSVRVKLWYNKTIVCLFTVIIWSRKKQSTTSTLAACIYLCSYKYLTRRHAELTQCRCFDMH